MRTFIFLIGLSLTFAATSRVLAGEPTKIEPEQSWSGKFRDSTKQSRAPKLDFISDAATFEFVWKSWRREEPIPKIDFETKLVLLGMTSGPNTISLDASLEDSGNVTLHSMSTLVGGPGFGYSMKVIDRKGIKTVQGVPIDGQGYLNVSGIGTLETGVFAIGGETTGTIFKVRGAVWELDFSRRPIYHNKLKELQGKSVYVSGALIQKPGVEISRRSIVYVDAIGRVKTDK